MENINGCESVTFSNCDIPKIGNRLSTGFYL